MKKLFVLFLLFCLGFLSAPAFSQSNFSRTEPAEKYIQSAEPDLVHPTVKHVEAETIGNIRFYTDPLYEKRAESVVSKAERAIQVNIDLFGSEIYDNTHVYVIGDISRYWTDRGLRSSAPPWAAGLALLSQGVVLIELKPREGLVEPLETLAHELNHIALWRLVNGNWIPHWYYEGLALVTTEKWKIERAKALADATLTGQLFELKDLAYRFPEDGAAVSLAYAQSGSFVNFLHSRYGVEKTKELLDLLSQGIPFYEAFTKVYDAGVYTLEREWRSGHESKLSLFAEFMTEGVLFFILSLIGILAMVVVKLRTVRRRRRSGGDVSIDTLPENLRNIKPFFPKTRKKRK